MEQLTEIPCLSLPCRLPAYLQCTEPDRCQNLRYYYHHHDIQWYIGTGGYGDHTFFLNGFDVVTVLPIHCSSFVCVCACCVNRSISGFNKAKRAALRQPFLRDRKNGANYLMSLLRCNLWRNYNKQIPACKSINPTIFLYGFYIFCTFRKSVVFPLFRSSTISL